MMVRIGHLSTFYHTAVILMADKGFDRKIGAEVQWRLFGTGPAIVNALEKQELDIAYIGLPPAIIGIDRGVSIRCIAGGHIEGTVICGKKIWRGYPELNSLGDVLRQFEGHRIGVPGKGSIHDVILAESLERFGLRDKTAVVNFPWADQVLEAVVKDEVAAAFGTPALAVSVQRYADGKILYPPSELWPYNPSYGILMSTDFLEKERGLAERFVVAHEEATSLLRNSPEEASGIIAGYVGFIEPDFVLDTLMVSPKYCAQLSDEYIGSTMRFVHALKKLGYIGRDVPREEIFDTSLIRKVHPEEDHYG